MRAINKYLSRMLGRTTPGKEELPPAIKYTVLRYFAVADVKKATKMAFLEIDDLDSEDALYVFQKLAEINATPLPNAPPWVSTSLENMRKALTEMWHPRGKKKSEGIVR